MRRFTKLANGSGKRVENLRSAVGLHFAHYNFVRQHKNLRASPGMLPGRKPSLGPGRIGGPGFKLGHYREVALMDKCSHHCPKAWV
jgi:hypothetical protein